MCHFLFLWFKSEFVVVKRLTADEKMKTACTKLGFILM